MSLEGCLSGHYWSEGGNGGICTVCYERLHCFACGVFVRVDGIDSHVHTCRILSKLPLEDLEGKAINA